MEYGLQDLYVRKAFLKREKGLLSIQGDSVSFVTSGHTLELGTPSDLSYSTNSKAIIIETKTSRHTFLKLGLSIWAIKQKEVKSLFAKAPVISSEQTKATSALIASKLSEYESWMYQDGKNTIAMLAAVLDASGAQKR